MIPDCPCETPTLGQQLIDYAEKNPYGYTQEVRETTDEMGKRYNDELQSVILRHRNIKGKYYILCIMKKEIFAENVMRCLFVARRTPPTPEWNQIVYSYDNTDDALRLEWILPSPGEAEMVLNDPLGWDCFLVECIEKFRKGLLK